MDSKQRTEEVRFLLTKPYLKTKEVADLIGKPWSTTKSRLKANEDRIRYEDSWGWLTADVIKVFDLQEYKKMMMR